MFLLLTLNIFHIFSYCYFEQVNISWEKGMLVTGRGKILMSKLQTRIRKPVKHLK